jgi:hypothetical protein
MAWYDSILPTLAAVAPSIATAFGGPLAGMGVKALEGALGVSGSEAVQKAVLNMDPETAAKVRAADQAFAAHMKELDIDLERVAAADRDSARKREADVKDWMPKALGLGVVGAFLAAAFLVLTGSVPNIQDTTAALSIGTIFGYLANEAKQVLAYYFGSSVGSAKKDDTIQALSR